MRPIPYLHFLALPALLFGLGFMMNAVVVAANHGQMPVLTPGGCDPKEDMDGRIHSCMVPETRLKFLADWILIRGMGIASPGDFIEWAGERLFWPFILIWCVLMIKDRQEMSRWTI
jgi:hypothetical protein